ncbi:MAG: SDR family oxidoreductase [Myxococcales bacterium]|jgi:uncharacterized protein YbjT (DUF2867 family)
MTTLVIGANGKIGRELCRLASETGTPVRAMVRHPDQRAHFEALGVEAAVGDLEGEFRSALRGCEQVVFTAGSGPRTGPDKTLLVDLWGAVRAIDASLDQGVKHFVMISALRAEDPLAGPEKLRPYLAAKRAADLYLGRSGLRHTILRPGRLTDEPASGKIRTSLGDGENTISRANVARCLLHEIQSPPPAENCTIDLLDGETPIAKALS